MPSPPDPNPILQPSRRIVSTGRTAINEPEVSKESALPRALLWDVDGTIAETELEVHRPAFNRAFADAGLPWRWDRPTYLRLLAVGGGRERLAAYLEEVEGVAPSPRRLDALQRAKQGHYATLVAAGALRPRPGVERLMAEASAAGIPQAVVTTSSRSAVEALARHGMPSLGRLVALWICGEDVVRKKPDPEAYQLALSRLTTQLPDRQGDPRARVLAIEDSTNGLQAAHAAGIGCLITLSQPSSQEPRQGMGQALAICDGLGDDQHPTAVVQGPACPGGLVTLSWLGQLLERR
jgi:HAD superfamily hydrolase (TIGR01509 family)